MTGRGRNQPGHPERGSAFQKLGCCAVTPFAALPPQPRTAAARFSAPLAVCAALLCILQCCSLAFTNDSGRSVGTTPLSFGNPAAASTKPEIALSTSSNSPLASRRKKLLLRSDNARGRVGALPATRSHLDVAFWTRRRPHPKGGGRRNPGNAAASVLERVR